MKKNPEILKESANFRAEVSARGIRLVSKIKGSLPPARVVGAKERGYISGLGLRPDANGITEFDASMVWDYGMGAFSK